MVTMETIRQQYPHPRACPSGTPRLVVYIEEDYCVGGAVCRAAAIDTGRHFPSQSQISRALQRLNTALDPQSANNYAADIITSNDGKRFADAWVFVDAALTNPGIARD